MNGVILAAIVAAIVIFSAGAVVLSASKVRGAFVRLSAALARLRGEFARLRERWGQARANAAARQRAARMAQQEAKRKRESAPQRVEIPGNRREKVIYEQGKEYIQFCDTRLIRKQTAKAVLAGDEWLPKSQIVYRDGAIYISGWLFQKRFGLQKYQEAILERKSRQETIAAAATKLKDLLRVSNRVRIGMVREFTGLDDKRFLEQLVQWAAEYKFKIDGEYVVTEGGNVDEFVRNIDAMFEAWDKEGTKEKI